MHPDWSWSVHGSVVGLAGGRIAMSAQPQNSCGYTAPHVGLLLSMPYFAGKLNELYPGGRHWSAATKCHCKLDQKKKKKKRKKERRKEGKKEGRNERTNERTNKQRKQGRGVLTE